MKLNQTGQVFPQKVLQLQQRLSPSHRQAKLGYGLVHTQIKPRISQPEPMALAALGPTGPPSQPRQGPTAPAAARRLTAHLANQTTPHHTAAAARLPERRTAGTGSPAAPSSRSAGRGPPPQLGGCTCVHPGEGGTAPKGTCPPSHGRRSNPAASERTHSAQRPRLRGAAGKRKERRRVAPRKGGRLGREGGRRLLEYLWGPRPAGALPALPSPDTAAGRHLGSSFVPPRFRQLTASRTHPR